MYRVGSTRRLARPGTHHRGASDRSDTRERIGGLTPPGCAGEGEHMEHQTEQLFDPGIDRDALAAESAARRDEAILKVDIHGEEDDKFELLAAVQRVAFRQERLVGDDIWFEYERTGRAKPHEPRLLGAIMRTAQKNGWVAPTDEYHMSVRPEAHRGPKRVWRSLIVRATT